MKYNKIVIAFFICILTGLNLKAQKPAVELSVETKIEALIKKMTLEEKVNMIHANSSFTSGGVKRLGIPELVTSDGPHGVRPEFGRDWNLDNNSLDSGTYLPTGICLAATWNSELGYAFGSVLGSEANYRGKDIILGPGINIIRSPLNGRNFEYQSEDPFLVSKMAVGYIKGVQSQGVSACVKHFIANNQETKRTSIDVQMSDRAMREIYLPGFKAAVQLGGVNTVMGSYNKFRGQWASENNFLLTQILKKEWGFKGMVMSDWDAVHSTVQALWSGLDLEMGTDLHMLPNPDYSKFFMAESVLKLVKAGKIPEYIIDEKIRRKLYIMFKTNMIDGKRIKGQYNTPAHQKTALQVASEGIVLLKNRDKILPINKTETRKIAVIGYNADRKQSMGGGSSQVRAFYEITALQGIRNIAGNTEIVYAPGYEIKRDAKANPELIKNAVSIAAAADMVIYVGGSTHGYDYSVWSDNAYDAEDTDKPDMNLPFGQDELIMALVKANPKLVVVLMGGGALDMNKWLDETPAVIQSWYPGMEGGNALAKILFGELNPSGKLPVTFPNKLADHPSQQLGEYPGNLDKLTVHYYDDIYVGYRYYDTYNVQPQFAFGHGLSYTTFEYGNLKLIPTTDKVIVSLTIKNTGNKAGAEVAQLYIKPGTSLLPRPEKELKEFSKIFLQPGESKTVSFTLNKDAFMYYNDVLHAWVMDKINYDILVGSTSRDIRISGKIKM